MAICLKKSCSFGLMFVSFVNVYESVCVFLSLLVLKMGCVILFMMVAFLITFLTLIQI